MARSENISPKGSRFVVLASMCIVVAALYFAQEVLIPLALAVLFCFLLTPLVSRLERWRVPRAPAVIIVVSAGFALVLALGWVVTAQVLNLANRLPEYETNIIGKVERFKQKFGGNEGGLGDKIADAAEHIEQATTRTATQPATTQAAATQSAATQTTGTGGPVSTGPPGGAEDALQKVVRDPLGEAARTASGSPTPGAPLGTSEENPLWTVALPAPVSPLKTLGSYLGVVASPLATAGLVVVFVIFILLRREDLRDRMIRLVGRGEMNVTTQALDDAGTRISRYLLAQAIVNRTYGIAIALGLWAIGHFAGDRPFPSFVLWGLLCAVLRFIPYIGPWIAALFPLTLALAVYPGFEVFAWALAMFVVVELLSNNIMEPWLYGASTGMSTIAVLVSAVFWTWLWGAVGRLLATPLTVCLVVMGKYVPRLGFLDILLGDEPVLEPSERVYQRLLAGDEEEAGDLAREMLKEGSLLDVYDGVLVPALSLVEQDRHRGRLDEPRQRLVRKAMREIVDELGDEWRMRQDRSDADVMKAAAAATVEVAKGGSAGDPGDTASGNGGYTDMTAVSRPKGVKASSDGSGSDTVIAGRDPRVNDVRVPRGCTVNVVCLPSHDEADEVAALMLAQLLEFRGYCAFPLSVTKLASEMVDAVEQRKAHVVVVSSLPPAAVTHSRYLCKRLHARFPDINMVVGLWTAKGDLKKAKDRIACAGNVQMASKLAQALEQIGQLVQPVIVAAEDERLRAEARAEAEA